jgi:hypothetical protein
MFEVQSQRSVVSSAQHR